MRKVIATLSVICVAVILCLGCNKYADHEVKTPVPPRPQQNN